MTSTQNSEVSSSSTNCECSAIQMNGNETLLSSQSIPDNRDKEENHTQSSNETTQTTNTTASPTHNDSISVDLQYDAIANMSFVESFPIDQNNKSVILIQQDNRISTTMEPTTTTTTSSPLTPPVEPSVLNVPGNDNNKNKNNFVTLKDFELLKVIGMGSFGKVLQVKQKYTQQVLAMKVISKRLLHKKISYIDNIQAERDILTKIRHPFVVNMHCSFQTREKLFIIMDFLSGGELFLRLGREGVFLESTAKFYIAEIILALEHLHSKGILHRYDINFYIY